MFKDSKSLDLYSMEVEFTQTELEQFQEIHELKVKGYELTPA